MAAINHTPDLPDQICYVQCGFCSTILLVSVPCSRLSMVVTVRCGHCTSLLSVNMMKASFVPLHLLASITQEEPNEGSREVHVNQNFDGPLSPSIMTTSDNEDEDAVYRHRVVNKPPEKRQRAPSLYNRFIKEEIRRLKVQNPKMTHKDAFSQAAKNWAHFPSNQNKGYAENLTENEGKGTWNSDDVAVQVHHAEEEGGRSLRERKVPRHFIWEKTPFGFD